MNAVQAKQLPLRSILERLGHVPQHETRGELWYTSPFREETQPSFKINEADNVWYDFGAGVGGNVLDFIMQLHRHRDISAALKTLESLMGSARSDTRTGDLFARTRSQERPAPAPKPALTIRKVQPLQNRALIGYLQSRGITPETAAPYVEELYYSRDDKHYFALAFANGSGGYELRNPYFKGVIGSKDITLLRTAENAPENQDVLTIFEGFIDFLSALTHDPNCCRPPVLVLNSITMKDKALALIRDQNVRQVTLYLDRDTSGQELTTYFQQQLDGIQVLDASETYADHKDFNDFLVATHRQHESAR